MRALLGHAACSCLPNQVLRLCPLCPSGLRVPFVPLLQGRNRCWYAGAYTLINTHEIAVMSGLAAADRLGAPYPFGDDPLAKSQYSTYFKVAHGFWTRHAQPAEQPAGGKPRK